MSSLHLFCLLEGVEQPSFVPPEALLVKKDLLPYGAHKIMSLKDDGLLLKTGGFSILNGDRSLSSLLTVVRM